MIPNYTDNQIDAINKLKRLKVGALFMRPGTGKTRTAIELVSSSETDFALWIVPFQTKNNLETELNKWEFKLPYKIIGVESLSNSDRLYLETIDLLKSKNNPFIIVDESLKIKNSSAIRSKRVLELSNYSDYKLILNGTPLSKNLLDIYPQMQFLSPKILKMSEQQFKDTFCNYIKFRNLNKWGQPGKWREFIKSYENLDYLYKLISPFIYDADLHLINKKSYINIDYSIEKGLEEYSKIKHDFITSLSNDPDSFIKTTQAMQHCYCDEPEKIKIVKKITDNKTAIFVKFIKSKKAILKEVPEATVFSYGKSSYGLNLQSYNKIIFFDKTFDYAQRDQAEHRIYRLGQKDNVTYYDLTGNVNLEGTINKNINYKGELLNELKKLLNERSNLKWENII